MYPNVKAEMARNNITLEMLAKPLNITISTLSKKLSGKYPITLNEAKIIKDFIKAEQSIDELFKEALS